MEFHRTLQRQIKKSLPAHYLQDNSIVSFLGVVSDHYDVYDKDKKISDHAFAISEKEYQDVLARLKKESDLKFWSIKQLRDLIVSIDPDGDHVPDNKDDIIYIIDFLQKQVAKSKEIESYLKEAKLQAENSTKAKSEFLSVMSHEIRTPLNAVIGYIHLLSEENTQPSQTEYFNILNVSAHNLLTLINDILDFSKIEEGKIVFENSDFDIRKLVNDIKLANKIMAGDKGNSLKVMIDDDVPQIVKGDMMRLTQILNNIISNAIKFTLNGQIVLEVQLVAAGDDFMDINFSVKDNGIGISKEYISKIFDRFTQAHSNISREYGGSGLGLTIIKKLLVLQNSDIYIESEVGKGSRFFFNLRFGKGVEKAEDIAGRLKDVIDLKGLKVLIVDDVEINVYMVRRILQTWNAVADAAENGKIAVEKIKNGSYDVVLMDVQMPVMDGLTATIEIRKFNKDIPLIPLSASTSFDLQEDYRMLGVNDFLYKPIDMVKMHKVLTKYVK